MNNVDQTRVIACLLSERYGDREYDDPEKDDTGNVAEHIRRCVNLETISIRSGAMRVGSTHF